MGEPSFRLEGRRMWVAGHRGMAGSAIVRRLATESCEVLVADRAEVDLARQAEVEAWLDAHRPEGVVVAAGRVGGIEANSTRPADFIGENLAIALNVIQASQRVGVEKLLYLGSSCAYPREAAQPMGEGALLTGPLESTNEWYAVAKIAGVKLCQAIRRQHGRDFVCVMPTNLYGPGDNYDPRSSHVAAALIHRFHEAKQREDGEAVVWGSGEPRREFLHVDDLADACVHVLRHYGDEPALNVGCGEDLSIREFAGMVARVVGYAGQIRFDRTRPDGAPRKLLDVSRLRALGWRARIGLEDGLGDAYRDYLSRVGASAGASRSESVHG